ncbi:MAG: hypothetical protein IBX52_06190 [Bacterioplanes sp.]|nr:hypothetical protein [Bacterioplanes sp.]
MEGIMEFSGYWLAYLGFALVSYWCWTQLFFWLRRGSDVRQLFHLLGAVLIFAPAPIEQGANYFAPAFVIVPFVAIGDGLEQAQYAIIWWVVALCIGALLLTLRQLQRWLSQRWSRPKEDANTAIGE